jgi:hypothetical protein
MGYQRGERGRLASLITVIILGTAVVSIDHISGRSVGPPARSEAANQVISMELATASPARVSSAESQTAQRNVQVTEQNNCGRRFRVTTASQRAACREPIINSIKLKARELQDTDWPILARLSGITKPRCFLEVEAASIPPLENRLMAVASQVSSIRNVSIRIDGEVRISKAPAPGAPARLYLTRAVTQRDTRTFERSLKSLPGVVVLPMPQAWKSWKRTS